jgi:hypothetical protein
VPIIAAPYDPPAAAVVASPWTSFAAMTWTAPNGDMWDLKGAPWSPSGVVLQRGARGLGMPPSDRFTTKSPAIAGSRSRGYRTDEREVIWPLKVFQDGGSTEWMRYDRAFWSTMAPDRTGVWTVTHPDGQTRSLTLRFVNDGNDTAPVDPMLVGWALYGITLVAEQPYWEGTPLVRSWKASAPVSFFGAGAPSFYISSGSTFSTATIDNPGDVEMWPQWVLSGPITSAAVGVNGHIVQYAVAIPDGQYRIIDTRPDHLTIVDQAGADRLADLGQAEFAPVPAGASVPLDISVVGAGTVTMIANPLYQRAW